MSHPDKPYRSEEISPPEKNSRKKPSIAQMGRGYGEVNFDTLLKVKGGGDLPIMPVRKGVFLGFLPFEYLQLEYICQINDSNVIWM